MSARLGLKFPADYIELCKTYGAGKFAAPNTHEIFILDICDPHFELYQRSVRVGIDLLVTEASFEPRLTAHKVEKSSLFPLGFDGDRRDLIWATDSDPEKWRIILFPYEDDLFEVFDLKLTEFLAGFFSGRLFVAGWQSRLEAGRVQKYSFVGYS